jgi:hypothetical protein
MIEKQPSNIGHHKLGGGWGNRIEWAGLEQFDNMENHQEFHCHGWKTPLPKVGDTLLAEFEKSWITFRFVEIKRGEGVSDMFFGTVVPVKQEMK